MPRKPPLPVVIEPSVMKWLFDSSGWTKEDLAKRLGTSVGVIDRILSGEKKPSLRQLEELSSIFKRPLAAFLLSKPLEEKPKPRDYRMIAGKKDVFDKKTLLVMRKARLLQELSGKLSKNIRYETGPKIERASVKNDPEALAKKYRGLFGLTEEKQVKFRDAYALFNYLRDVLEDMNVYVFQLSMPLEDARGFIFVDQNPPVIVLSTKDPIEARIFSLMHEFGHLLLGESVIDLPDSSNIHKEGVERWCDRFSASFLLPKETAKDAFEASRPVLTRKETLRMLSRRFKVSKAVLLRSMVDLSFIRQTEYDAILAHYRREPKPVKKTTGKGGGVPSDVKCISEVGNKFVSLVANNYDRDFITYTDALNYLSIRSKNFDKVLAKARK